MCESSIAFLFVGEGRGVGETGVVCAMVWNYLYDLWVVGDGVCSNTSKLKHYRIHQCEALLNEITDALRRCRIGVHDYVGCMQNEPAISRFDLLFGVFEKWVVVVVGGREGFFLLTDRCDDAHNKQLLIRILKASAH